MNSFPLLNNFIYFWSSSPNSIANPTSAWGSLICFKVFSGLQSITLLYFTSSHCANILTTAGSKDSQRVLQTFNIFKGVSPQLIAWNSALYSSRRRFGELENHLYVSLIKNSMLRGRLLSEVWLTASCKEWQMHVMRIKGKLNSLQNFNYTVISARHYWGIVRADTNYVLYWKIMWLQKFY